MPRYPTIISKSPATRFFLQSDFAFSSIAGLSVDVNPLSNYVNGGSVGNGDPIQTLVDYENDQKSYIQATLGKRPLWNATDSDFNGLPSMTFDGFDDFLIRTAPFGSDKGAIFAVVTVESVGLLVLVGAADILSTNKYLQFCTPHNSYQYQYIEVNNAGSANAVRGTTNITTVGTYVVGVISNGDSWNMWLSDVNENEVVVSAGNNGSWFSDFAGGDNLTFGILKRNAEVGPFFGRIARLLIYDNVTLSNSQISLIQKNLKLKYGVS